MSVDLNADLGEGFGIWTLTEDDALLDVVTSANVACGFHAGDPRGLRQVCACAAARGVAVGAQVSYRDLVGFGRRFLDVEPDELEAEIIYQIGALDALCRVEGHVGLVLDPVQELEQDDGFRARQANVVCMGSHTRHVGSKFL